MKGTWRWAFLVLSVVGPGTVLAGRQDPVVARIGDEAVTMSRIETEYEGTSPAYRDRQLKNPDALNSMVRRVVERKVLALCARREGLDQDAGLKSRIERQVEIMLAEAYAEFLKADIQKAVTVDEAEVEEYYEKNRREFMTKGRFRLLFIAVKDRGEAVRIRAQLEKGGDFGALARKHSIHPSGHGGGDLGWIEYGKQVHLDPAVAKAVRRMDAGDMSGVISLRDQFCIVKMAEREPPAPLPLNEVAERIQPILRNKKEHTAMEAALAERMKAMDARIVSETPGESPPAPR